MAAIEGFTAEQNKALEGVQVGDIILVYKPRTNHYDEDDGSTGESDDEGNEDDGEEGGVEGDDAGEGDSNEDFAQQSNEQDEEEESGEEDGDSASNTSEINPEDLIIGSPSAESDLEELRPIADASAEGEHVYASRDGLEYQDGWGEQLDGWGQATSLSLTNQDTSAADQDAPIAGSTQVSSADNLEGLADQDDVSEPGLAAAAVVIEGLDPEAEQQDGTANATERRLQPTLFAICELAKNQKDEITSLRLVSLTYDPLPGTSTSTATYHLHGTRCAHSMINAQLQDMAKAKDTHPLITDTTIGITNSEQTIITAKPTGDIVRHIVHHYQCPAGCNDGRLPSIQALHGMVRGFDITTILPDHPPCPSCIGIPLMREYQLLRGTFEAYTIVDLTQVADFLGRLNPRRVQLGYDFEQLDERKWNYLFDDMPPEDEDEEGENGDGGRYEVWDEAMDLNSNIQHRPASQGTIDALPRKTFSVAKTDAEVKVEEGDKCVVCQEAFEDEKVVVELPCKHVFCDGGCAEQWLKQFATCPSCRAKVPEVPEVDGEAGAAAGEGDEGVPLLNFDGQQLPPNARTAQDDFVYLPFGTLASLIETSDQSQNTSNRDTHDYARETERHWRNINVTGLDGTETPANAATTDGTFIIISLAEFATLEFLGDEEGADYEAFKIVRERSLQIRALLGEGAVGDEGVTDQGTQTEETEGNGEDVEMSDAWGEREAW
jgi:hypothetical protein